MMDNEYMHFYKYPLISVLQASFWSRGKEYVSVNKNYEYYFIPSAHFSAN